MIECVPFHPLRMVGGGGGVVTYVTLISSQLRIGRFQLYANHVLELVFVRPALGVLSTQMTQNICQWQIEAQM